MTHKNLTFALKDSAPNAEAKLATLSPDNAGSVIAWLISGEVGIDDIAKAMYVDFEPIMKTQLKNPKRFLINGIHLLKSVQHLCIPILHTKRP